MNQLAERINMGTSNREHPNLAMLFLLALFAFSLFAPLPLFGTYYKIEIGAFIVLIIWGGADLVGSILLERRLVLSAWFVVLLLVVPLLSVFQSVIHFDQPLWLAMLAERRWLHVLFGFIIARQLATYRITTDQLKYLLICLTVTCLVVFCCLQLGMQTGMLDGHPVVRFSRSKGYWLGVNTTLLIWSLFYSALRLIQQKETGIRVGWILLWMLSFGYIVFLNKGRIILVSMALVLSLLVVVEMVRVKRGRWIAIIGLGILCVSILLCMVFPGQVDKRVSAFKRIGTTVAAELSGKQENESGSGADDHSTSLRMQQARTALREIRRAPAGLILGYGRLSRTWRRNISDRIGYFFPEDLGWFGYLFVHGFLGVLVIFGLGLVSWRQWRRFRAESTDPLVDSLGYLVAYLFVQAIGGGGILMFPGVIGFALMVLAISPVLVVPGGSYPPGPAPSGKRALVLLRGYPFPAVDGGRRVTVAALKVLAESHVLDIICYSDTAGANREPDLEELKPLTDKVTIIRHQRLPRWLTPLFNMAGLTYFVFRDFSREYERAVAEHLRSRVYDVVLLNEILVSSCLPAVRRYAVPGTRIVGQLFNVNNLLLQRYMETNRRWRFLLRAELFLLKRHEVRYWNQLDETVFISETDRRQACCIAGRSGAYRSSFPPGVVKNCDPVSVSDALPRVLHVGTGSWAPNADGLQWFLSRIWDRISSGNPQAELVAAGGGMPAELKRFESDRVQFPGFVEDLESLYQSSAVFVVPLRFGSGIKIKLLDAMARGLPVVATSVAVEGLDFGQADGVLVRDEAQSFCQAVIYLLDSPEERTRLGKAARRCAARFMEGGETGSFWRDIGIPASPGKCDEQPVRGNPEGTAHECPQKFNGPLFIVGLPRSGTTLLLHLLNRHPDICLPLSESHHIPVAVKRFGNPPVLPDARSRTGFLQWWQDCMEDQVDVDFTAIPLHTMDVTSWTAILERLLKAAAGQAHVAACIWGDKTPGYLNWMAFLKEVLPTARFIHIVRDPRDRMLSVHKRWGKSRLRAMDQWHDWEQAAMQIVPKLGPDYCRIHYEELIAHPEQSLRNICRFLGVTFHEGMTGLSGAVESHGDVRSDAGIDAGNTGKFRDRVSSRLLKRAEEIVYPTLQAYGYEPVLATRHKPLSGFRKLSFSLYDKTRLSCQYLKLYGAREAWMRIRLAWVEQVHRRRKRNHER